MPSPGIAAVLIGITVATVIYFFFSSSEEEPETPSTHLVRRYRDVEQIPSYSNTDSRRNRRRSHPYGQGYSRVTSGICSICLESLSMGRQVVLKACKHIFHEKCIDEWVSSRVNQASCPNCRCNI